MDDFRFRYRRHDVKDDGAESRQKELRSPDITLSANTEAAADASAQKQPAALTAPEQPVQKPEGKLQQTENVQQDNSPEYITNAHADVEEPLIPLEKLHGSKKQKSGRVKKLMVVAIIILLVTALVGGGYLIYRGKMRDKSVLSQASDVNNNSEGLALAIKNEVSKYLEDVPAETPTLETVQESGTGGQGFQDTQQGDKILYFDSVGKAIIYRPSTGKVLVYTYFTTNSTQQDRQSQTPSTEADQGSSQ